ncbi:MAG: RNA 2',3'-cyclic phosphodiesterase [Planctomycetes bacterium]|nr:RNA 2',3'-cyclic phosphodiesterase [Planctomycetota bacterium]
MPDELRTFVAIDIGAPLRAWLEPALAALKAAYPKVRWVKPENIHLTLCFLGATRPDQVPAILALLEAAARAEKPLALAAGEPGSFGRRDAPRVFWLALQPGEALDRVIRLQAELERGLAGLGFPKEDRPWTPHLTFGRNPRHERAAGWEKVFTERPGMISAGPPTIDVDGMILFSSTLTPAGPVYRPLGKGLFQS